MAQAKRLSSFEKYLSLWVALCILVGIGIGWLFPAFPAALKKAEVARVSIPVAILIWLMIYPMMAQIEFSRIVEAGKRPKGLALTLTVNWAIKPFTMAGISALFLFVIFKHWIPGELAREYYAGAILLGAAPCTAMVFVWSYLSQGDPAYTLVQVAVNDLVLIFLYAPIVKGLLGLSNIYVPYDTVLLSVVLYVVIPLALGYGTRRYFIARRGEEWFEKVFLKRLRPVTIGGLLLTLGDPLLLSGRKDHPKPGPHLSHCRAPCYSNFLHLRPWLWSGMVAKAPTSCGCASGANWCVKLLRARRGGSYLPVWPGLRRSPGYGGWSIGGSTNHAHLSLDL